LEISDRLLFETAHPGSAFTTSPEVRNVPRYQYLAKSGIV